MHRSLTTRILGAAVVSVLAVSSCGENGDTAVTVPEASSAETSTDQPDDDSAVTSVAPNGEAAEVLALDNNFRPEEVEIEAGTTVNWENGGRNEHNIVPVDDTDGWGVDIEDFGPGDVYSYAFTIPGEYPYYCTLHGTADFGMIGTIVVTA